MWYVPPGVIVFLAVQLPATLLLGLVAGVLAAHIVVVRRGRLSLRASAVFVLLAALESAAIVQNPAAWGVLTLLFGLTGEAMALVDAGIMLGLDRGRPVPRFTPRTRRRGLMAIPFGLVAVSLVFATVFKFVFALNPAAVSWLSSAAGFLGLLVVPALLDATIRVIFGRINHHRPTG